VKAMLACDKHHAFYFTLADKFGEYGLISVVIMEEMGRALFLDTWIMSCRVLSRGVEAFAQNHLVRYAHERGFSKLVGEYLPTGKNALVKDHYKRLGYSPVGGRWEFDVASGAPLATQIAQG